MSKLIGRFFFKLTDSKNLIGEFSNNDSKRNYTESAVLKPREPDEVQKPNEGKFIGVYFSTWYEEDEHSCVLAELKIEQKYENIFSLTWWRVQDRKTAADPFFLGEGILCDGILIGDYRHVPTS
jgi:hypothetical protein